MNTLMLPAPAKLNHFLHINGRRDDGYHNIQTLFQFVDFGDVMHFSPRDDQQITISGNFGDLPLTENIIFKAASLIQEQAKRKQGVDIRVDKHIPMGGGLGGGSSNAATTLIALNYLWGMPCSGEALLRIAPSLGADVPIFLWGHSAFASGLGDVLESVVWKTSPYLLVIPPESVNTKQLFGDKRLTRDTQTLTIEALQVVKTRNAFEPLVRADYPGVELAFDRLSRTSRAHLSGTGSTVFAAFQTQEEAMDVCASLPKPLVGVVCQGQNVSPLVTKARQYGINYSHWGVAKR